MASIYDDRRVQWRDPVTGRRRTRSFPTVAAAKHFAAEREHDDELVRSDYLDRDQLDRAQRRLTPISGLLDDYEAAVEKRGTTKSYRAGQIAAAQRFVDECRVVTVQDFEALVVDRFLHGLVKGGASARTHNHYRSALSGFGRWLEDFRYLERNPVTVVRSLDQEKDRRRISRALTVAEADALVAATICPRRQCLHLLRLRTGIRVREASRLAWSDFDLAKRIVNLRPAVTKNGKADLLPLTDDVCELLVDLQRDALRSGCPTRPDSSVFGPPPDRRTWRRDLDRAKLAYTTRGEQADQKCLRKTYDSLLTRAGIDLTLVSLLMRHTPMGGMKLTLGVYGDHDALLDRKREALTKLARWIETQRPQAVASGA